MKNKLLLISVLGISSLTIAQSNVSKSSSVLLKNHHPEVTVFNENQNGPFVKSTKKNQAQKITNVAISDILIGQAGNAFGMAFGGRTFLWADPSINAITMSHRSNPTLTGDITHGFLRYDYSKDDGASWLVDQGPAYQTSGNYAPPFANARYPQGILFNPTGNIIADSAYFTYFAPSLASVNGGGASGGWGGHVHGVVQTSGNLPNTQTEDLSSRYLISDGFTLTKTGVLYNSDAAYDNANSTAPVGYKDTIIINKGIWNATKRDFDYTESRIWVPVSKDNKGGANYSDNRISFADDGNTGYLTVIGHTSYTLEPDTIYYLIVYKTIDAGVTWTGPININMDGVQPLLPKAGAATKFSVAYDHDAVVDGNGNLHVIIPIFPFVAPNQISIVPGAWGEFDVYTTDAGTTWRAKLLGTPGTLRGTFGVSSTDASNPSIAEYNRGQASRNFNGTKLFFTWFDTDTLQYAPQDADHANLHPNAYSMGLDVATGNWTNAVSTEGSAVDGAVTFGSVSYYVFENSVTFTVPIAYQELTGDETKTGQPTQLHYIDGLTINHADFTQPGNTVPLRILASVNDIKENNGLAVSQNYPNPFNNTTSFTLSLAKNSSVSVDVYNTLGQKVMVVESKTYAAGNHSITIDGSRLEAGIYFYNVKAGEVSVTRRMIVK